MFCFHSLTIQAEADRFSSHTVLIADYQAGEYSTYAYCQAPFAMRARMPLPWVASLADAGGVLHHTVRALSGAARMQQGCAVVRCGAGKRNKPPARTALAERVEIVSAVADACKEAAEKV